MNTGTVERRYQDGTYLAKHQEWDRSDSPWKASLIQKIFSAFDIEPRSICDVGCGAGDILSQMRMMYPEASLTGFDISQDAAHFWKEHEGKDIQFQCKNFLDTDQRAYDCILLLDVIEHLANPFDFLAKIAGRAKFFVFHFPLDLSALSVLRENRMLQARREVGHIHYFSKGLALALLYESGFDVLHCCYTNASVSGPAQNLKTKIASLPRRFAYFVNKDFGTRLLGGETLMVLAEKTKA